MATLNSVSRRLAAAVDALGFARPITHVQNPLVYARVPHELYLKAAGGGPKDALFLGMNPGPFGMAQTGVPFGDVAMVRDFLGIEAKVLPPTGTHPKRPVQGFACTRPEVSGTRLWGLMRDRCGTADKFFSRFFVANYCPLVFMEESGRNFTPDKLPARERMALYAACDEALRGMVAILQPRWVIGVGAFAEKRAREALMGMDLKIGTILHPSPASPAANRDWAGTALRQMTAMGISI